MLTVSKKGDKCGGFLPERCQLPSKIKEIGRGGSFQKGTPTGDHRENRKPPLQKPEE